MSEKRFVIGDDNIAMFEVIDMEKEELVCECRAVDVEKVVDLLNEQQDTITALNEKIEQRNALLDKIEKALGETIEEWLLGVKYR